MAKLRQSTQYFFIYSITSSAKAFCTKRTSSYKLTQILTGHCRLKMYLNHIGVEPDHACSCGEYVETVDHYLFYFKLEHSNRTNTIIKSCFEQGIAFLPSREILINNKYLFDSLCFFLHLLLV